MWQLKEKQRVESYYQPACGHYIPKYNRATDLPSNPKWGGGSVATQTVLARPTSTERPDIPLVEEKHPDF